MLVALIVGGTPSWAADPWPLTVGRLEEPVAVRLVDGAPAGEALVSSEHPVAVAEIRHGSGPIPVRCGTDVRFRCFAEAPEGPVELCAGPGDAACLDGARLQIPQRTDTPPHRLTSPVPDECTARLRPALNAVDAAVVRALGEGNSVLLEARSGLVDPRLHDACKGWYGQSGRRYNGAWCAVKAAERGALFVRLTGSSDGVRSIVDALTADCCVGGACEGAFPWPVEASAPEVPKPSP